MAKISQVSDYQNEIDCDQFLIALIDLQNEMRTSLDRLAKIHIEELKKIEHNDILRKKFELKCPHITKYIKKRTAENWKT